VEFEFAEERTGGGDYGRGRRPVEGRGVELGPCTDDVFMIRVRVLPA
jgi:hypothetical protein